MLENLRNTIEIRVQEVNMYFTYPKTWNKQAPGVEFLATK